MCARAACFFSLCPPLIATAPHVQINLTGFLERNTGAFSKFPAAPEHPPPIFELLVFCLIPQRSRQARFGASLRCVSRGAWARGAHERSQRDHDLCGLIVGRCRRRHHQPSHRSLWS